MSPRGFNKEEDRIKAERYVVEEKPLVLIGSPPCVAFSQLQALIPDSERKAQQLAEGIRHMEFIAKLYKNTGRWGRIFLHENPAHAKSCALHPESDARPGSRRGRGRPVHVWPEDAGQEQIAIHVCEEALAFHDGFPVSGPRTE